MSVREAIRFYFAGLFANLFLPSLVGGDIVRAGMAMRSGRRKTGIIFGSLLDRLIDVFSLFLLVVCAGGLTHRKLINKTEHVITIAFIAFLLIAGGISFSLVFSPSKRIPKKIRFKIQRIRLGFRKLFKEPYYAVTGLCLSLIIQSGFVMINTIIGKAMGITLAYKVWFLTWPLAKISAMLPLSFCGFGIREAAFAGLLQPFGIRLSLAVAQSVVWETVIIAGGIFGGILWKFLRKNIHN